MRATKRWEDAWTMRTPRECWLTLAWWANLEALPGYGSAHLGALCKRGPTP